MLYGRGRGRRMRRGRRSDVAGVTQGELLDELRDVLEVGQPHGRWMRLDLLRNGDGLFQGLRSRGNDRVVERW